MQIKTSELTGWHLDYAVAVAEDYQRFEVGGEGSYIELEGFYDIASARDEVEGFTVSGAKYEPSTDWAQGGPIIEREKVHLIHQESVDSWIASLPRGVKIGWRFLAYGPTPLIAAMRCYVAIKLGDTVEIPENLT